MQNNFTNSLRVSPEYFHKKNDLVNEILNINEKYYTKEYRDLYKCHFLEEFLTLKNIFPEIDFDYSGRFKNKESMTEKIFRKINVEHKTGNIYDNFANKIVIYSVNGSKNEEVLKKACFDILNFLLTYNNNITNEHFEELKDKRKDYITAPKSNGYQSIHLIRKHLKPNTPSYLSETQIRTFRMEEQQKFGNSSHSNNYKRDRVITINRCPIFLKISKSKKTGLYKVHEYSLEESYKKYLDYTNLAYSISNPNNLHLQK